MGPFVAKKTQLMKMAKSQQCDGTMCPAGCCPNVGWYCCPDNMYCAATAADCPFVAKKTQLMKMAKSQQCDGSMCPAGWDLAIFISWVFLATNGQSAAVAAQYMLSGQQYQPTLGQQPAGHMVPSHCWDLAIFPM